MRVNPYLSFAGTCREAFTFYASVLEGRLSDMLTHGGMPAGMDVPEGWGDKILHAQLVVGDTVIMGSDTPPAHYVKPAGFWVSVSVGSAAVADKVFAALAAGGAVFFPIQETFWAVRFGMAVDRFGVPWMVNCEKVG
jgi:PhnB protein